MTDEALAIQYRTEKTSPRDDAFGKFFGFLTDHPLIAGLAGGSVGVGVAYAKAPGAFSNAPIASLVLSAGVLLVWMTLLFIMRPFFEQQTRVTEDIVRLITYDGRNFVWIEEERNLKAIAEPTFRLYTDPVPESVSSSEEASQQPWPAWVVVQGEEETRFVLETRVTADEATEYPQLALDRDDADEKLPAHVASPLLVLARAAAASEGALREAREAAQPSET